VGILPDSIKSILYRVDHGALTAADDQGRVQVFVKLPHQIVQLFERPLPIHHFLFMVPTPRAPVVGWFFEFMDNLQDPLRIDTYFNIQDQVQARDLERLTYQKTVPLHFVSGLDLSIVTTKEISPPPNTSMIFRDAVAHAKRIAPNQYDFDTAKLIFQCAYSPDEIATWQPPYPEPCAEHYTHFSQDKRFSLLDFKTHVKSCGQCGKVFGVIFGYVTEAKDPQASEE